MTIIADCHANRGGKIPVTWLKSFFILLLISHIAPLFAFTFEAHTDKSMKFRVFQQNHYIWMATNGGAIRWDMATNKATEYTTPQGLSDNFLTQAIADSAGNVWFVSRGGLDRFDGRTWQTCKDLPGAPNGQSMGQVLLSSDAGKILYTYFDFDKTIFACFDGATQLPSTAIHGALVWTDSSGRRWEWLRASAGQPFMAAPIFTVASATDTLSDTLPANYYYIAGHSYVDIRGRLWIPFTSTISSSLSPAGYRMFDGFTWHRIGARTIDVIDPGVPLDTGAGRFTYRFLRIDDKIDTVDCSSWVEFSRVRDSLCIPPSMTIDTAGRLWIGTESGLVCCDTQGAAEYDFQTGPVGTWIYAQVEDSKGNIWVCGYGLSIFNGLTWTYPQKKNANIAAYQFTKALPSASDAGGMWLMSGSFYDENAELTGKGLAYYNGRSWSETKFYTTSNGLASNGVVDIGIDSLNTVWCVCGGDSPSLCTFKDNTWTTIAPPVGLKGKVRQLHIDRKGGVWLMANNPARFDGVHWKVFPMNMYEGRAGCDNVFEDSKGIMWFATYSQGLYRFDGTDWDTVRIDAASPTASVTSIGEDATGALWVGLGCNWTGSNYTDCKGLWHDNGSDWKRFSTIDGLGDDLVTTISCDKSGVMWFACSPGVIENTTSVSCFDGTHWKTFTQKDGFSDTHVNSILNAKNGDIWFATYTGVTRLNSSNLAAHFSSLSTTQRSNRTLLSKILVTSSQHTGEIPPATLYDIRGRRVDPRNQSKTPVANGVYIGAYPKGVE
jgi:ligand-binding sensor domain-containing protein